VAAEQFKFGVIILAAGASRRMGRPKLLLPWGETTVLGHLIQQWNGTGALQIAIVHAADAKPLTDELDRLGFPPANCIANPTPENGMFSSIQCAARWAGWNPSLTHFVITLGDQPQLQESTLKQLLDFAGSNREKICQPMRAERRKHPVLLPRRLFEQLKDTAAADLKIFLTAHASDLSGFPSEDAGLDFDMDTPEDYDHLKQLFLRS
jgi:molybdenum cofactor cytidylyltransferase